MNAIKAIYYLLRNNTAVTDIVGTKLYYLQREQQIGVPCVTYQIISNVGNNSKSGGSDLDKCRVQLECISETPAQAHELAEAVRQVLEIHAATSVDGVGVQGITYEGESSNFDNTAENEGVFYVTQDYFVTYER